MSAEATLLASVGSGLVLATLTLAGSIVWQVRQHDDVLFGSDAATDNGLAGEVVENAERIEHHDRELRARGIVSPGPVRTDGGDDHDGGD